MKNLVLAFLSCFSVISTAQNTDSLRAVWLSEDNDLEERFNALEALSAFHSRNYDLDSAAVYYEILLDLAREHGRQSREVEALLDLGVNNYYRGNYQAALAHFENGLALSQELKDTSWLPDIYRMTGVVLEAQGSPEKSLDYYRLSYE